MNITTGFENRRARIEIVPLIDVVFLLLVFFVYAMLSMVVYRGVRVDLPSAAGITEELKTIIIAVSANNQISVDGEIMQIPDAINLAAEKARDTDFPVLISGDMTADLGVAIELLDGLRKVNVGSVSFQVRQSKEE